MISLVSEPSSWLALQDDFDALDTDGNKKLSLVEMTPWLTAGINKYITEKKRLNHGFVFTTTDLDLDGAGEYYRHPCVPMLSSVLVPFEIARCKA